MPNRTIQKWDGHADRVQKDPVESDNSPFAIGELNWATVASIADDGRAGAARMDAKLMAMASFGL